jgi:hypothetical protein
VCAGGQLTIGDVISDVRIPVVCAKRGLCLWDEVSEKYETSPGLPSLQMGVFEERPSHTPGMHWVRRFSRASFSAGRGTPESSVALHRRARRGRTNCAKWGPSQVYLVKSSSKSTSLLLLNVEGRD